MRLRHELPSTRNVSVLRGLCVADDAFLTRKQINEQSVALDTQNMADPLIKFGQWICQEKRHDRHQIEPICVCFPMNGMTSEQPLVGHQSCQCTHTRPKSENISGSAVTPMEHLDPAPPVHTRCRDGNKIKTLRSARVHKFFFSPSPSAHITDRGRGGRLKT